MKTFMIVALVATAVFSMAMVADAAKSSAQGAHDFCDAFADDYFDSYGDCMSNFRSAKGAVNFCKEYGEIYAPFFGWENQGDCVSFFRSNGGNN